ncbi:hypothetical protein OROMI_010467 [Orobanche minor]
MKQVPILKPLSIILLLTLLATTTTTTISSDNSKEALPDTTTGNKVDNETIYNISKQPCWGCIGESLEFLFAHNLVRSTKWELPLQWDSQLER